MTRSRWAPPSYWIQTIVCSLSSKPLLSIDAQSRLDALVETAVKRGAFSGASLLVSRRPGQVFERMWGRLQTAGDPVTPCARFDLASLTKPLVTAPLCMTAVGGGYLELDDPISRFFPGRVPGDKEAITVEHLLSHASGLPAWAPFYLELVTMASEKRREALAKMILQTPLINPPGTAATYSDLGFMLLGLILERQMGGRLDGLARDLLFAPLGIDQLHFYPRDGARDPMPNPEPQALPAAILPAGISPGAPGAQAGILAGAPDAQAGNSPGAAAAGAPGAVAATQFCPWRKRLLCGEVDDENAWALDGVAGHAGLFGTARGVFDLLSFLWKLYEGPDARTPSPSAGPAALPPFITAEAVRLFWRPSELARAGSSTWRLGFDTPSPKGYTSAGRFFSQKAVGHLGFTGVSFWLDLEKRVLIIFLTNRVHPTRKNDEIRNFRPLLHDIVMKALLYDN
ncbi:MAG: serine hydrolase [Syntrophobacteraceae bacterium]|nr:serine hydrolase [Syntrophobacteraceae bacterium]